MAFYDCLKFVNEAFFSVLVIGLSVLLASQGAITVGTVLTAYLCFTQLTGPLRELHRILDEFSECVVLANDYITGKREVSGRVVLVGGGLTGLETAEMLTHSGKVTELTIADMLPEIGMGVFNVMMRDIEHHLDSPTKLPGHMLSAVTERGAVFTKTSDQSSVEVEADYVVLALGLKKRDDVLRAFDACFNNVITLGENRRAPGRIAEAISDGFEAAYCFEP